MNSISYKQQILQIKKKDLLEHNSLWGIGCIPYCSYCGLISWICMYPCRLERKQKSNYYEFLPLSKNTGCPYFRLRTNYFLLPRQIPIEISRRLMLFKNLRQHLPHQTLICTYNLSAWKVGKTCYWFQIIFQQTLKPDTCEPLQYQHLHNMFVRSTSHQSSTCDKHLI